MPMLVSIPAGAGITDYSHFAALAQRVQTTRPNDRNIRPSTFNIPFIETSAAATTTATDTI